MSNSTFAVSSTSESDIEKDIDLELDACDENGIMSTTVEGELPKDHTYTKGPVVLEDELKEILESSSQLDEMFNHVSSESSRPSRTARSSKVKKAPAKPKAKKSPAKKAPVSKRNKSRKEVSAEEEEEDKSEDVTPNGDVEETKKEESKPATKPGVRASKRKIEEKENVLEQTTEESAAEESEKESPPAKKQSTRTKKAPAVPKSPKKKVLADDIVDSVSLPKGWVRKTMIRKSGKTAGQYDIYIYSPDGLKFRSKPDIAGYLMRTKSNLKLDLFDFSKKKMPYDTPDTPQKKPAAEAAPKPKTPSPKKKTPPPSPTKSPKLLVKIVSAKGKRKAPAKGKRGSARRK